MSGNFLFVIVGKNDNPIYQLENLSPKFDTPRHYQQLIIHSTLDIVDEMLWKNNSMYMKVKDKFGESFISAFVTAGNIKLMLLHDFKNEDGIKNFFTEVYEGLIKIFLNPFYVINTYITSPAFDYKVKNIAKKYLKP